MLGNRPDALGASDPLAALTALVQNGTSLSTAISTLSGQIADAVQTALPQLGSGASRAQLVDAVSEALSPPGNAPPGTTAAQQVAALARRLQTWIGGVAREAVNAGQQNDNAGYVLDAEQARELPAQQDPKTSTPVDRADALARSLLASVAAALANPPGLSPATDARVANTPADSARVAPNSNAGAAANGSPPSDAASAQSSNAAASTAPAAAADQSPADLLARMLVRAANLDATLNPAPASVPAQTQAEASASGTPAAGGQPVPSPQVNVATLTALLADAIGAAVRSNTESSPDGSNAGSRQSGTDVPAAAVPAKNAPVTSPVSPFAATVATAPVNASIDGTPAGTPAGTLADANAVVEQVVKAMAMRSNADGTSEVRLRLEPEQLGTVTLKLTVDGTSVSATAIAQNADVRSALMAHQQQLARSLSESGLKLTSFSVDLSGGDTGSDRNRDRTTGFGRRYAVHEVAGAQDGTQTIESTSTGPSLLPGSTVELFNYLA